MKIRKIAYLLFVFIPLFVLFLLGTFLDTDKTKSERERRKLAQKTEKPLMYPQAFEKYLSDHLWGRDIFLDIYFKVGMSLNLGTNKVLIGKKGWLFQNVVSDRNNLHNLLSYANKLNLSEKQLNKIRTNLLKMKQFCDENNIKMYLMFPPDKHRIYARYMPSYILREERPSLVKRIAILVPEGIRFVKLEDKMIAESFNENTLLYYKTESHWSEDGAYLAYRLLMDKIKQDFPDIQIADPTDFNISSKQSVFTPYWPIDKQPRWTKGNLFLEGIKTDDVLYTHYELKPKNNIQMMWSIPFVTSFNPNKDYNVYMIGDSYAPYLSTFLAQSFKNVYFYRFNPTGGKFGIDFLKRQSQMIQQKTDILIMSVSDLKILDLERAFNAI